MASSGPARAVFLLLPEASDTRAWCPEKGWEGLRHLSSLRTRRGRSLSQDFPSGGEVITRVLCVCVSEPLGQGVCVSPCLSSVGCGLGGVTLPCLRLLTRLVPSSFDFHLFRMFSISLLGMTQRQWEDLGRT